MDRLTEKTQLTMAEFLQDIGGIAREYRDDTTTAK
jgi:hypothetical protein